jgi:hypothetical protein
MIKFTGVLATLFLSMTSINADNYRGLQGDGVAAPVAVAIVLNVLAGAAVTAVVLNVLSVLKFLDVLKFLNVLNFLNVLAAVAAVVVNNQQTSAAGR